ncbi:MAG: acyl-CoA thioesterase [Ignavibacteriota bacterium]|nr:MAG: acyl-CoA thioesterase [Chlorobiota bacterium]MBE7476526.1 acyl-CoA thioesterase [Ignavibacteriales bacterium]MBL1123667.1 acyl-CoA thioesterase [Ignavibacteriota bacterium]MCC7094127.1 acyl-CoA thioesterase [Ignavibacteriaceae bacterium]MCE7855476.1 acyl-CoA thioesterase [Ignavibacteria bacterium CHB3]MEB2294916.1 thioesterase family protein [Ignavibacteria bacterium]
MLIHKTTLRVRYADTDQMQYAYNGKYFEYFEVGRTEMMREHGLTYKKIEESGFHMPVYEAFLQFKNPAFYDEQLEIETRVEKIPQAKVHIDHTIRSLDRNIIIAEGYIELAFIKSGTKKITRAPEFFTSAIEKFFRNK